MPGFATYLENRRTSLSWEVLILIAFNRSVGRAVLKGTILGGSKSDQRAARPATPAGTLNAPSDTRLPSDWTAKPLMLCPPAASA